MKTAAIFNPYWDTLGGGEKYVATVALAYEKAGFAPLIAWHDTSLLSKLYSRFNLKLSKTLVNPSLFNIYTAGSTLTKIVCSAKFDNFFWVSDGSVPLLVSKNNILHFQVPFHHHISLKDRIKLKNFDHIICNSQFTKTIIDRVYSCRSQVLYPPVIQMPSTKKENIILSVGRFDNILHAKRQDILIEAFKQLNAPQWTLVLTGGSLNPESQFNALQKYVGSANIQIVMNPTFEELKQLYGKAKIYWHAAGFGSNLTKLPEKAEHFGIATVEAMSAGAVPVVFAGGGQLEIIKPGENGYLWKNIDELIIQTRQLISTPIDFDLIIQNAKKTAATYDQSQFITNFIRYVS